MRCVATRSGVLAAVLGGLALCFTAAPVHSHGVGQELTAVSGSYVVDIATNALEFSTRVPVVFDFSLREGETLAPYDSVWVQIKRGEKVLVVGALSPLLGREPSLVYRFPERGEYTLNALFYTNDDVVAEASFPLIVSTSESTPRDQRIVVVVLVGAILGGAGVLLLQKVRESQKPSRSSS